MRQKSRAVKVALRVPAQKVPQKSRPWYVVAIGGAVAVGLAGWLLLSGAVAIGWLSAADDDFTAALRLGTELWLLTNGSSVTVSGMDLSVAPLGVTAIIVLLATGAAGYAAQQGKGADGLDTSLAWRIVAVFTASYVACVVAGAVAVNQISGMGRGVLGSVLISGVSSAVMVLRAAQIDLRASWPSWAKAIPRAAAAALLVVTIGAGIALSTALLLSMDRIVVLHDSLKPGIAGGLLLLAIQLAYLPNFVAWCASWTLGAGFSIGAETVIAPTGTRVGLLPSLPIFGAVPAPGAGSWTMAWWLVSGVIAGVAAAVIVVRARPAARLDEAALAGGLAGVVAGLLVTVCCAIAGGSFGGERLTVIGARLGELVIIAPALLGIAGLVAGLVLGLLSSYGTGKASGSSGPSAKPAAASSDLVPGKPTSPDAVDQVTTKLNPG